jgi:hypothetical protein
MPQSQMSTFVFFHVGDDLFWPKNLVHSLRLSNPGSEIVMVSDSETPPVDGVNRRVDINESRDEIMFMRMRGFAAANCGSPAFYLDTDMQVLGTIDPTQILGELDAVLCRRSFDRNSLFNHKFRNMGLDEFAGKSMNEVFPILGCATVTRNSQPWLRMSELMEAMDGRLRKWYGDQQALKLYALESQNTGFFEEKDYACLPEYLGASGGAPKIVHFKGRRK